MGRFLPNNLRGFTELLAMKPIILICLFCFIAAMHVHAADEPLIPTPLNDVLLKVSPGMTTNQVLATLSPSYPKVAGREGDWSGQTGYIDYKLDESNYSGRF